MTSLPCRRRKPETRLVYTYVMITREEQPRVETNLQDSLRSNPPQHCYVDSTAYTVYRRSVVRLCERNLGSDIDYVQETATYTLNNGEWGCEAFHTFCHA